MKPYETTKTKGMYHIKPSSKLKYPVGALRPTKNAAGMAYTRARSGHGFKFDLLDNSPEAKRAQEINTLSVRGTLDSLKGLGYKVVKMPCESCKCKCNGKLRLKKNA